MIAEALAAAGDKTALFMFLGFVAATLVMAQQARAAADPVFGVWLTQAKDGKVRIAPCAADPDQVCGTIVWARGPAGEDGRTLVDEHNPDAALRKRPVVGMPIIWDFRHDGEGGWTGGRIYDPAGGKTYKAKMASEHGTLKVAGCVLFFCRAETWTRVD
jgi:uncharacterized protein (DUF2147 family)